MSPIALLVSQYQTWQSVNHYSSYNAKNIRYYLHVFIRFLNECHIHRIEDITYEVIKDYQEDLSFRISRYGSLWKVGSQNNAIGTLKSFLKWLVREDYLVSDPSVKIEYAKEPEVLPRNILDESEINRLLAQPDTHTAIGYRDRVVIEILYSTGIRKAELENLKLSDVDYTDGYLRIDEGKGKKDRVVPLGTIACEMIRNYILAIRSEIPQGKYRNHDSGYLFINQRGNKLHHDRVWQVVKGYAKQGGIKKKVTPHSIRHYGERYKMVSDDSKPAKSASCSSIHSPFYH